MNYLFEMRQIEEMQKATGRFKTALGKEGKPQYERITKIAPDKVEVYAERVPSACRVRPKRLRLSRFTGRASLNAGWTCQELRRSV